ncbi:MAG TPA: DUF6491 family protein [Gammaproteobacteria bacterium]|nr:DUF6491 family protein [Gammaproteobacteria bacterium]
MGRAKRLSPISLGLASILLLAARGTAAQEDFDRTPVDCVVTTSIDRTQAVDDRTILFFMRGKRVYRNDLPRKCPELQRQNRIMYKTRGNRLCDVDTITVLQQWGARLEPGFTCGLGKFVPITQEEVDDLVRKDIPRDGVESKAVQLPPAEGDAGDRNGNADAAPAPASPPVEDAPK